ncbi:protein-tyrosine phosphatase-like protein, partial [Gaertneriomyces semiglobifer]
NRYYDIIPYDRTRVHLQTPSLPEKSDYINATHVRGLDKTRDYIISQGPLHNTSGDFWQMILEQGSALVVMLTREEERGRVKCHRYWPSIADQPVTYSNVGGLTVTLVNESTLLNGEATLRELQLTSAKDPSLNRKVWQLHFVDWPDHRASAPASVLAVLDLARQLQRNAEENGQTGPMVVHCSAGCGRTGTLCTIDSVLLMLEQGQEDDQEVFGERDLVRATVEKFREQRVSMVQTLEQYVFCYEAIL